MTEPILRILYVSGGTLDNGGISAYMRNYYYHFDKQKLQVDFVVQGSVDTYDKTVESMGARVYHLPDKHKSIFQHYKRLFGLLFSKEYTIVHSHMDGMNGFLLALAKFAKIPIRISHSHNTDFLTRNSVKLSVHRFSRKILKYYGTHFWACSSLAGQWLYQGQNFEIIPNAIDVKRFKFNNELRRKIRHQLELDDKFVIGNVGRLSYQKNQVFLLECLESVLKVKPNAILVLVGKGEDLKFLKTYSEQLKIDRHVIFMGEREDINDMLNIFDIFVFPSHFEGFGTAALEAQTNGLQCICSTKVPREIDVLGNTKFISLQDPIETWRDAIVNCDSRDKDSIKKVVHLGYEIGEAARRLQEKYRKLLK